MVYLLYLLLFSISKKMKKNYKIILILLSLIIFSIPSVVSLFQNGFPLTDDGNWMIIRLSSFYENLREGQFPVRFLSRLNNGYGYPVADFLYPGFLYLGSLIHILGFSFETTIKIILGISLISSSVFCFLWLRKLVDDFSAFLGSLVYLYFPYHLYDAYKRGSVGEVLSLAILPLILWQIERKSIFWSAIGIFLLILAHNTLAVLFLLFIFAYMGFNIYISKNRRQLLYEYTGMSLLGLGMSAFFWIPAVFDLQYTVFSKTQVSEWDQYFANIDQIGLLSIFTFGLILLLILFKKIDIKKHRLTVLILVVGMITAFMASSLSAFLWNVFPVAFIQFPFRFLSLVIVCVAFLSAVIVSVFANYSKIIISLFIIILMFVNSISFISPTIYQNYPDSFYSTNQATTTVKNEYMPKWVKQIPVTNTFVKVQNISGEEMINVKKTTVNKIIFQTFLSDNRIIQINTIYFPGWSVYANGGLKEINYDNENGLIRFVLEKGQNDVRVVFEETPIRLLSDLISMLSLISLFVLLYLTKYKKLKI